MILIAFTPVFQAFRKPRASGDDPNTKMYVLTIKW